MSLVAASAAGLKRCGVQLRAGGLVAFPTETVYGLGANALDESAVLSIFEAKGRPLTDPVIVHVSSANDAREYLEFSSPCAEADMTIFSCLAEKFWPGPLTIVTKAKPKRSQGDGRLPGCVSANTGFVGVRCPEHPVARALIEEARVPIAAPSANRFGHVSPTAPQHVLADLANPVPDLLVVDGGCGVNGDACRVGIESTVLRVHDVEREGIVVFRLGGVPFVDLRKALDQSGFADVPMKIIKKQVQQEADQPGEAQCAPGQAIKHYAPDIDTRLVMPRTADAQALGIDNGTLAAVNVARSVVVDFGAPGILGSLESTCLAYRNVSPTGDVREAARNLFDALRWTEEVQGAEHVLIADISDVEGEMTAAVCDRLLRAASGKRIMLTQLLKKY